MQCNALGGSHLENCFDPFGARGSRTTGSGRKHAAGRRSLVQFRGTGVRASIERRRLQDEFIARGLAGRDEARRTGEYVDAEDVLHELGDMLAMAEGKAGA